MSIFSEEYIKEAKNSAVNYLVSKGYEQNDFNIGKGSSIQPNSSAFEKLGRRISSEKGIPNVFISEKEAMKFLTTSSVDYLNSKWAPSDPTPKSVKKLNTESTQDVSIYSLPEGPSNRILAENHALKNTDTITVATYRPNEYKNEKRFYAMPVGTNSFQSKITINEDLDSEEEFLNRLGFEVNQ